MHEDIAKTCFKAVYNFIQSHKLKNLLFYKGRRYNYQKAWSSNPGKIKDRVSISQRHKAANDREALYHFEYDTIVGKVLWKEFTTVIERYPKNKNV